VKLGGKWGFINISDDAVIDFKYEFTSLGFCEGLCAVIRKGLVGFINKEGEVQIDFQFSSGEIENECRTDFKEGFCVVHDPLIGKYIYINKDGKRLGENFESVYGFSNGLGLVRKDNLYGFINSNGQLELDPIYRHASLFREGVSVVLIK
jgi:hypothetical protein